MHKRKSLKIIAIPVAIALLLGLTACSGQSANKSTTNNRTAIYGQVKTINGSDITMDIGTLNQRQPSSSAQPQNTPANPQASPSQSGQAPNRQRGMTDFLTLTGETKTITVTDTSTLTKRSFGGQFGQGNGNGQGTPSSPRPTMDPSQTPNSNYRQNGGGTEAATLSDITVGSILMITYQGNTITAIEIINN